MFSPRRAECDRLIFAENFHHFFAKPIMRLRKQPASVKNGNCRFRFYFHLLKTVAFLHFEVVLSGEKWSEVDLSGLTSIQFPLLGCWLKGDTGAATSRQRTGHGGREGAAQAPHHLQGRPRSLRPGRRRRDLRHYLTSLDGKGARLYPLPVWEAIEARLAQVPGTNPAKRRSWK